METAFHNILSGKGRPEEGGQRQFQTLFFRWSIQDPAGDAELHVLGWDPAPLGGQTGAFAPFELRASERGRSPDGICS